MRKQTAWSAPYAGTASGECMREAKLLCSTADVWIERQWLHSQCIGVCSSTAALLPCSHLCLCSLHCSRPLQLHAEQSAHAKVSRRILSHSCSVAADSLGWPPCQRLRRRSDAYMHGIMPCRWQAGMALITHSESSDRSSVTSCPDRIPHTLMLTVHLCACVSSVPAMSRSRCCHPAVALVLRAVRSLPRSAVRPTRAMAAATAAAAAVSFRLPRSCARLQARAHSSRCYPRTSEQHCSTEPERPRREDAQITAAWLAALQTATM